MRRLLLTALLCLLPAVAHAACPAGVCTVGAGKDYTVMATAFAALANDDVIESYGGVGGYTENNQTLQPAAGITGVTWNHYEADYTFDGGGGTATFLTLAATNTGWDIDVNNGTGRVVMTGYIGANPFVVTGASNTVGGFRLTANGAAGVAQVTAIATGNSVTFTDILIDNPVDPTNQNWTGIYLNGASQTVTGCEIKDATLTGATQNAYPIYVDTSATLSSVSDCSIHDISHENRIWGVNSSDNAADLDVLTVSRCRVYDLTADRIWGLRSLRRAMVVSDVLAYGFTAIGTDKALEIDGGGTAMAASVVSNLTVVGPVAQGLTSSNNPAASVTARNCIVDGSTALGYYSTTAGQVLSSYNVCNKAAGAGFFAFWNATATDLDDTDPLFQDAANDDYSLSLASPCLDTGMWPSGRSSDLAGQHAPSGPRMDRGCYEYQQDNPRSMRTRVTVPPTVPTRDEGMAR